MPVKGEGLQDDMLAPIPADAIVLANSNSGIIK
jgi:hypothetical protein